MNIAFDVDNVLADTLSVWVLRANRKYALELTLSDIKSHKNPGAGYLEPWQTYSILDEIWNDWENVPLTDPNIVDILNTLSELGSIDIATSRPERSLSNVKKWLAQNDISYDTFYGVPPRSSKNEIKSNILIDDAPEHAKNFSRSGRVAILYDRPWNQGVRGSNIVRINTLNQIIGIIEKEIKKPKQQYFTFD